ncbi:hypothetical protein Tco_1040173 [Tanacetum coccineum]
MQMDSLLFSDLENRVFILKGKYPSKRNTDLSTGFNFLGHGLLYDHAKACDYFASQPVLPIFYESRTHEYHKGYNTQALEMLCFLGTYVSKLEAASSNEPPHSNLKNPTFQLHWMNMLQICLKLPGLHFVDTLFKEDILEFQKEQVPVLTKIHQWSSPDTSCLKINSIPKRNKVNWHMANNDPILTTIRFIPQHEVVQKYGKKWQPARGLETLSEVHMKEWCYTRGSRYFVTNIISTDDEEIYWKTSSDDDDDDDDNEGDDDAANDDHDDADNDSERTESDNEGDEFVHPKFTTHEEDEKEEESSVRGFQHFYNLNFGILKKMLMLHKGEYMWKRSGECWELYHMKWKMQTICYRRIRMSIWRGRDAEYGQKLLNYSSNEVTHVDPIAGLIRRLKVNSRVLLYISVITIAKPPLVFATTIPPTPTPLITHMQQTPFPIPTTAPSTSLQDLPNFDSLFGFDHRFKTLETNFSEFKKTNQFAEAVSSIPGIVDAYLTNKMNDAVKTAVQLQSDRLRDEAQAENKDFLNKLDDNIKKIIKEQVKEQVKAQVSKILPKIEKTVNEQHEAEVMTRSSTKSKTSLAIAANLSELELKKILIEKMESNKSINRSNEQKNIYTALVEAYESDKLILDTYGDTISFKRRKDDEDKDEEPSAGSNWGSKRRRARKEPESTSAPK